MTAGRPAQGSGTSGERIKVLVVAESEPEVAALRHAVAGCATAHLELEHAAGALAAFRFLSSEHVDALLLDVPAADPQALELVARLHERSPDIPILVLTAAEDESLAVAALKAGAQDSLVKGRVDGNLLVRAVRYAIERNQLQVALHAMALVDDLTGLYNRRGFQTLARQQLKMADRLHRRLSHIFVDLDGLKAINDSFGHREGDRALVETAALLRETFRESDIIARIGGDEFVVLAMETAGHPHEQWATRLQEHLTQRNAMPDRRVPLSVSVGMAYYDPDFPCAVDDLLHRADSLMYEQKRSKRRTRADAPPTPTPPRLGTGLAGDAGIAPRAD